MPIIQTINLEKIFKGAEDFKVLQDINISIEAGEFVSIIGQSGSGKSTLLYVLSTLDTNYNGDIIVNGTNLRKLNNNQLSSFRNKEIGFVFQFHYLLPEFTVAENVSLPALKLGKYSEEEIRERALQKLDMLGLKSQADKKASQLSGGQQQRVAIARSLINDPKILFGDEPTGNLDSQNSKMVFEIFLELKKSLNQTIVIVTHDNELAARTDRRITLKDGFVVGTH
jgi:lipoprotein-releasing system ATP-binding protein